MAQTPKPVIVTVDDDAVARIHDLAKQLGSAGLDVTRVMPLTGVITGHFSGHQLSELKSVPGVSSVEMEEGVQIAPPDAGLQ